MRDFIFDQYGYYYADENASEFTYADYRFKLLATDKSEEELQSLESFISSFYPTLSTDPHCHLVANRSGIYGVESEFGQVTLVTALDRTYDLNAFLELSKSGIQLASGSQNYTITNLVSLWEEKLNLVEEKCIPYLKVDDFAYPLMLKETVFAVGLCSNAIEYLTDLRSDYGDEIKRLTLSHRRLSNFSGFDLYNPFNIVCDSPVRDLASLYKAETIDLDSLLALIDREGYGQNEISLLLARALFPEVTFDILEDNYSLKRDIKIPIVHKTKRTGREMERLAALHQSLVDRYHIRPIEWLFGYEY